MNIHELNSKNLERAKKLAEELGVTVKLPDLFEAEAKAKRRLDIMAEYNSKKELYDTSITKLLEIVSAAELLEIIKKMQSTKN